MGDNMCATKLIPLTLAVSAALAGCANVRESANDEWMRTLKSEGFTAFTPPREGMELGNIITFDENGREYIVARGATCLRPLLENVKPVTVRFLESKGDVNTSGSLAADFAKAFKGKADIEAVAKATASERVVLKLGTTQVHQFELLALKNYLSRLDRMGDCYKTIMNPKNVLILNNLSANGLAYEFKESGDKSIKLTASILAKASLSPELRRTNDGMAALTIEQTTSIAYRGLAARELPGFSSDKFEVTELTGAEIESYRDAARKR